MEQPESIVASLLQRVEALEQENERLRQAARGGPSQASAAITSRRGLLAGSAGLIGALAGAGFLERGGSAGAAAEGSATGTVHSLELRRPVMVALQAVVPVQHSGGKHWAHLKWDLAGHFTGARAPVVVASAVDDFHGTDPGAVPTCAVSVQRTGGSFQATLLLGSLSHLATEATVNAIAFGESPDLGGEARVGA